MNHPEKDSIVFLTVIAGRKQEEALLTALLEAGMRLVSAVYGRGTVTANYLLNTFGLIAEEKKVIITCASTQSKVDAVLALLVNRFHFDQPNTGIAYTSHIDKVSY